MIFASDKLAVFRRRLQRQLRKGMPYVGASRRATNLLPGPAESKDILLKGASISGYSNLLLSLEAHQKSGCLIVQSERHKSRSGILIYRGRILGCMYGQKNLNNYLFNSFAYERALNDLQSINKTVDVYDLKDELVIAASALFHGPSFEQPEMQPVQFFNEALAQLIENNIPGCIVVTDRADDDVYMVYVFAGKIVGIQSNRRGWLNPDLATIHKQLNNNHPHRVQACFLPCQNLQDVSRYSFSLTGLGDRQFAIPNITRKYGVLNIFYMLRMDQKRMTGAGEVIQIDKFLPQVRRRHHQFLERLEKTVEVYSVRP